MRFVRFSTLLAANYLCRLGSNRRNVCSCAGGRGVKFSPTVVETQILFPGSGVDWQLPMRTVICVHQWKGGGDFYPCRLINNFFLCWVHVRTMCHCLLVERITRSC